MHYFHFLKKGKEAMLVGNMYYILKGKETIPVDIKTYLEYQQKAFYENKEANTHVGDDTKHGVRVSTVFLGVNANILKKGKPLLFETMIFGGIRNGERHRYSTWEEAENGHKKIIKEIVKFKED
jgi:hypothetical protein